jgi:HEAT repeat protein
MNPRSPFVSLAALRGACAAVLALAVGAAVGAAAPPLPTGVRQAVPVRAQPGKKDADKKEEKKDEKKDEIKWPTEVGGKHLHDLVREINDPDPSVRNAAVHTLPLFGPVIREKPASTALLHRLTIEPDPAVKVALIGVVAGVHPFKEEAENKEAVSALAAIVDNGAPGGLSRLVAVQALAAFGAKGEAAVTRLTGVAIRDPSYETRRQIAIALGQVGINDKTGPNVRALTYLADTLAKDPAAGVRMEAMQSLMLLGPPWDGEKQGKDQPPINEKDRDAVVKFIKTRVGDARAKPPVPGLEKDKQVEIWARLVILRFDPREINDDNADTFAPFLTNADPRVRSQALQALILLGEGAGKRLKDVLALVEDKDTPPYLAVHGIQAISAMGAAAKPALPNLKKMLDEKKKPLDEKMEEMKKLTLDRKPFDQKLVSEATVLDGYVKTLEKAIKVINEAKPTSGSSAGTSPGAADAPKKP